MGVEVKALEQENKRQDRQNQTVRTHQNLPIQVSPFGIVRLAFVGNNRETSGRDHKQSDSGKSTEEFVLSEKVHEIICEHLISYPLSICN